MLTTALVVLCLLLLFSGILIARMRLHHLAMALALMGFVPVSGCGEILGVLPSVLKVITGAGITLDHVESLMDAWYAANPNAGSQALFKERVAKTRALLNAALDAAEGGKDLTDGDVMAAFDRFKEAYVGLADFVRATKAPVHMALPGEKDRALPGQSVVPPPAMLMRPTS